MFILLILSLAGSSAAWGNSVPGEIIVRFKPGVSTKASARALAAAGLSERDSIPEIDSRLVTVPPGRTVEQAIAALATDPRVEAAEPNALMEPAALPAENDGLFALQWALDRISATQAWTDNVPGAAGGSPVIIAVVDTGVSFTHEDLAGKLVTGLNAVTSSTLTEDTCNHGTLVAGVAAAATNNGKGVAGVAWSDAVRIMPIRVTSTLACTSSEWLVAKGIIWAAANGARVINVSMSTCLTDIAWCSGGSGIGYMATDHAYRTGSLVVAAAGNTGLRAPSFPAAYPHVLGVAATDRNDLRAVFSNYGYFIDVAAPGVEIVGPLATTDTSYGTGWGTSLSSPIVAGVAAMLMAQNPFRSVDDVVGIIQRTADQPTGAGWNEFTGYGRVNIYRALTDARTPAPAGMPLAYNYPNPFSPRIHRFTTFVVRSVPGDRIEVEIFDLLGNPVWSRSLSEAETAGLDLYHSSPLRWDGKDSRGKRMPNGVYMARIKVNQSETIKKIVVAR